MQSMPRSGRASSVGPGAPGAQVVIAAMVVAIAVAYAVLLLRPRWLLPVAELSSTLGGRPAWMLALAAAVSLVVAGTLCFFVLARVARGVQQAPYAWSAPLLMGISGLALVQMPAPPLLPGVPVPLFVVFTALLMLIGGALLQLQGWPAKLAGVLISVLPLLALASADPVVAPAATGPWASAAVIGRGFVVVLCATWLGCIALALVARPVTLRAEDHWPQLRDPLGGGALGVVRSRSEWLLGALTLISIAALAAAYSSVYLPLVRRVRAQQIMLAEASGQQRSAAEAALRTQYEQQLSQLSLALAAERTRQRSAPAQADEARASGGRLVAVATRGFERSQTRSEQPTRAVKAVRVAALEARSARAAARKERVARGAVRPGGTLRAARQAADAAPRVAVTDSKVRAQRASVAPAHHPDASAVRALGSAAVDDDPIGGL